MCIDLTPNHFTYLEEKKLITDRPDSPKKNNLSAEIALLQEGWSS